MEEFVDVVLLRLLPNFLVFVVVVVFVLDFDRLERGELWESESFVCIVVLVVLVIFWDLGFVVFGEHVLAVKFLEFFFDAFLEGVSLRK